MQCKANLYFDFTINTCNWPQNVDCQTTIVTNDLEDDSEAPSPTDYKLQDDEKRFNVEGADSNAKKSYHDSYIKGVNRMCSHQTNIKRNGKITDFDETWVG